MNRWCLVVSATTGDPSDTLPSFSSSLSSSCWCVLLCSVVWCGVVGGETRNSCDITVSSCRVYINNLVESINQASKTVGQSSTNEWMDEWMMSSFGQRWLYCTYIFLSVHLSVYLYAWFTSFALIVSCWWAVEKWHRRRPRHRIVMFSTWMDRFPVVRASGLIWIRLSDGFIRKPWLIVGDCSVMKKVRFVEFQNRGVVLFRFNTGAAESPRPTHDSTQNDSSATQTGKTSH